MKRQGTSQGTCCCVGLTSRHRADSAQIPPHTRHMCSKTRNIGSYQQTRMVCSIGKCSGLEADRPAVLWLFLAVSMRFPWGAVAALCAVLAASIALPIVIHNAVMEDGRQYARSEFEKMYTVRREVARAASRALVFLAAFLFCWMCVGLQRCCWVGLGARPRPLTRNGPVPPRPHN
jgi:hypothetical protein